MSGNLVVIEGACDGIGKTTQYCLLANRLKKDGFSVFQHHFPSYGTNQALLVEEYLRGSYGSISKLSPYFINSIYAIDRVITWNTVLKKEYENGNFVLLDRYTTSSLIYQSALIEDKNQKQDFISYICDFEYSKLGLLEPNHVIFLWAPFDLVTELRTKRKNNDGIMGDIHEQNLEYMKKVYDNAIYVANYLGWDQVLCSDGNKMRSIQDIHEDIYQLIKKK